MVRALAGGEMSVTSIAGAVDISVASASQHLARLRAAGLVTARRHGTAVLLRLSDSRTAALCDEARMIGVIARRLPD
jgi:DNA-binding transcriptional ArsR family regulator